MGVATYLSSLPRVTFSDIWIKPFREQVRASCGAGWKVLNSRWTIRLQVVDVGSVMLTYEWSLKGSMQALLRIQQIVKRWNGGQIT